ncbi:MAG: COG4315 family predicted lipoprotein [Solirubrobacteraceae bacterium]
MKRSHVILATVLACATSAASVASANQGAPDAHASRAAVVSLRHTSLGKLLVSSSGRTLYEFTKDHTNKDSCASIRGCSEIWPPLLSSGKPIAGSGVSASRLSTIKLSNGSRQVTYEGHPLYLYSADSGPGETSYVGAREFGGTWEAINSAGHAVK